MDFPLFDINQIALFALVFLRISVVLFMFPVFGSNLVPMPVKAGFSIVLAMYLMPLAGIEPSAFPDTVLKGVIMMVSEAIMGLTLALVVKFFFAAVQVGGQLVGYQMGFAIANVFDPISGSQMSILSNFAFWMAMVLFLVLNGHHFFIKALAESFALVPVGRINMGKSLLGSMITISSDMFSLALKMAAPAIVALLLTNAAFGIVAKVVPQINILIVAFPINVGMGLFFFGVSLELILISMRHHFGLWERTFKSILVVFGT